MARLDAAQLKPHLVADLCTAFGAVAQALAALRAYASAGAYLQQALQCAGRLASAVDLRADLLCALAEMACNDADQTQLLDHPTDATRAHGRASKRRARQHAHQAADLAAATSDPQWEVTILLRASDVLDRCGDHDDAELMHHHAQTLRQLAEARNANVPVPGAMRLPAPPALM